MSRIKTQENVVNILTTPLPCLVASGYNIKTQRVVRGAAGLSSILPIPSFLSLVCLFSILSAPSLGFTLGCTGMAQPSTLPSILGSNREVFPENPIYYCNSPHQWHSLSPSSNLFSSLQLFSPSSILWLAYLALFHCLPSSS